MTRIVIFSVCLYAFLQAAKFCVIRLNKIAEFFDQSINRLSQSCGAISTWKRNTPQTQFARLDFFYLAIPIDFLPVN
jgi:hypothetical protein